MTVPTEKQIEARNINFALRTLGSVRKSLRLIGYEAQEFESELSSIEERFRKKFHRQINGDDR